LRLLNYALKNVDVYWQITSSSRRDFHKDPSPLASREFQKIFELAQAEADDVRSEAAAIIRYYPVDSFEKLFRMNKEQFEGLPLKNKGRLAIAASFMYYNRITENLNGATATEKARIKSSIDEEFDRSQRWAVDSFFPGGSAKPFKAMLFYGRAAVERWALDDLQTRNFAAMLGVLRTTEEAYPLRYHHIAQAVAIVQAGDLRQEILERLKSIVDYPASTYLERNAILAAGSYDLYAGPGEKYTKLGERLEPRNGTRLLLRSGDWVFIHGGSRIGWLRRAPGS